MSTENREKVESADLLMRLPFDLAVLVTERLSTKEIYNCSLVSHKWREFFTSHSVLYPRLVQLAHFDQEPILFRSIPDGHEDRSIKADSVVARNDRNDENKKGEDESASAMRQRVEDLAYIEMIKNRKLLNRLISKIMNREKRWRFAEPSTRLYLPPVIPGREARGNWQGPVKSVKLKGGFVAILYEKSDSLHVWNIDSDSDKAGKMFKDYVDENEEVLKEQRSYENYKGRKMTDAEVNMLLDTIRDRKRMSPKLSVVKLRIKPLVFDFYTMQSILVTAAIDGSIDLYDIKTGEHKKTLYLDQTQERDGVNATISSIHIWYEFVVVGHGTRITLWNHETGEMLENAIQTSHTGTINGVFVLDNSNHFLSIDENGILVVTNRKAAQPEVAPLLDVPLYPMILAGQMGAPYAMRLLHSTHLCVWGKFSIGQFEFYEPGMDNLPSLTNLLVDADGRHADDQDEDMEVNRQDEVQGSGNNEGSANENLANRMNQLQTSTNSDNPDESDDSDEGPVTDEMQEEGNLQNDNNEPQNGTQRIRDRFRDRTPLEQFEMAQADLEHMYMQISGDRDDENPDGRRQTRLRNNPAPASEKYHILNIDSHFDPHSVVNVMTVDFRHMVESSGLSYIKIHEFAVDSKFPSGRMLGIYPVDARERNPKFIEELKELEAPRLQDEGEDENTRRRSSAKGTSGLEALETVVLQNMMVTQLLMQDPRLTEAQFGGDAADRAMAFVRRYFPKEYLVAAPTGMKMELLTNSAHYYIQEVHESAFESPVMHLNYLGEHVEPKKIREEMDDVCGKGPGLVSSSVLGLKHCCAAMDDGRIAVGCQNGYVVVVGFD